MLGPEEPEVSRGGSIQSGIPHASGQFSAALSTSQWALSPYQLGPVGQEGQPEREE